jgi:CrcB protein
MMSTSSVSPHAFSLQILEPMRTGALLRAFLNALLSVGLCVGAVAVGHLLAACPNDGAAQTVQIDIEEEV